MPDRVLTTVAGAERLGQNATRLEPWATVYVGDVEGSRTLSAAIISFSVPGRTRSVAATAWTPVAAR